MHILRYGTAGTQTLMALGFLNMQINNLFLHNHDTITHVDPSTGNISNIDLIFSTTSAAPLLHYKVFKDVMGSDHFPVAASLDADKYIYNKKSFKLQSLLMSIYMISM